MLYDFGKDRGIDGMVVDVKGNIYAAAGQGDKGGVYVFSPDGKPLAFIPTPETPTNCVFGGKDRKTLYVTAGKSLYRIRAERRGLRGLLAERGVTNVRMTCIVLATAALAAPVQRGIARRPVRTAIEKGLHRLEEGAANYTKNRQCFSCHHQAVPMAAFDSARRHGFSVDEKEIRHQIEFTLDTFRPQREKIAKGQAVGGTTTSAGYALFTLEMGGSPPDDVSSALVEYLLAKQRPDGAWPVQIQSTADAGRRLHADVPRPSRPEGLRPGERTPRTPTTYGAASMRPMKKVANG